MNIAKAKRIHVFKLSTCTIRKDGKKWLVDLTS